MSFAFLIGRGRNGSECQSLEHSLRAALRGLRFTVVPMKWPQFSDLQKLVGILTQETAELPDWFGCTLPWEKLGNL